MEETPQPRPPEEYEMPGQQPLEPEVKKTPNMPPDVIGNLDDFIRDQEEKDRKRKEKGPGLDA